MIEKILGSREILVEAWPVHGTSGYEFINQINGLFVDGSHATAITRIYHDFVQDRPRFFEVMYQKKLLIMQVSLSSELHMLTHQLDRLAQKSRRSRDFTFNTLRDALREVIACFPVYRSYIDDNGASATDRRNVELAVRLARMRNPLLSDRVFRFIRDMLLGEFNQNFNDEERAAQRRFSGKFQQVTSPVMAKGVEDTAFYIYNRLLSLNEVGGDPDRVGIRPEMLHAFNAERQARLPYSLSPLSTHDTKRSEDIRARINVLSELSDMWGKSVERWHSLNAQHCQQVEDRAAPQANEEYFIYQTLVGVWPLEEITPELFASLLKRIEDYMLKALREAKVHSSWVNPDPDYDHAIHEFVRLILDPNASGTFLDEFRSFQKLISHIGLFNSLSQTLLKLSSPGVPDTYQGTELWDFSLVDPDNRRPVDYATRTELLRALKSSAAELKGDTRALCRELVAAKNDGRIKLYTHYRMLELRRERPGLLSAGQYEAISPEGAHAEQVFAFVRRAGSAAAIVAVPRLISQLISDTSQLPLGEPVWGDTRLQIPADLAGRKWRNIFTGEAIETTGADSASTLAASRLFADFPVALLLSEC